MLRITSPSHSSLSRSPRQAADIQETVGCALAVQILSNGAIPLWAGCLLVSVAAFGMLQLDRIGYRRVQSGSFHEI